MPICQKCGGSLDPDGSCAACLLAGGLGTHADFQTSLAAAAIGDEVPPAAGEQAGATIGRYRLLQKIGEGGMGEVWLAEQREPVRRRVAVKLIKTGMNSREVIARFESERQALALMDHPAISKVLDAGSTLDGAPYFVMEYVAGIPITTYCDNHKLTTRQRLELFVHVCEGVQHAHQKAIIHRDLKPSNILVTEVDGKPAPKIIDFGVAKALTQKLTADTIFTRVGAMIGTPDYMSPEQALSSGEDVDTRTDVYSLGIILYELLAGAPPIELRKVALEEFLRRLREDDVPKPSTKVRTQDPATSNDLAVKRQTEPLALANQMRGEIDSIALKALEKERSRRYASPSDLAADIGRFLRNEAVLAVPPSTTYRARKFVRRYRAALAVLSAFVLVVIAAAAVSIRQYVIATRQRERADAEAAIAKAVNQFLQDDLLAQANPEAQGGETAPPDPDVKARVLLDRAAARVGKTFAKQPLVEASIEHTIGKAYVGLGLIGLGEKHLRRAYGLSATHRGADDPETLDLLMLISGADIQQNKYSEAVAAAKTVYERETRTLGPEDPRTIVARQNLASLYFQSDQYAEVEPLAKKALEIQLRRNGYDNLDTLNSSDTLAALYIRQSRYPEARALLVRGLESYQRLYGPDHPFTGREMFGLGKVLLGEGNYTEAEKVLAQVLALYTRAYGPHHPNTIYATSQLAQDYVEENKTAQGISLLEQGLSDSRAKFGPGDSDTCYAESTLAWAYEMNGDLASAAQMWQLALDGYRRLGSDEEAATADTEELLGQDLNRQHQYEKAEPLLRPALAFREKGDRNVWAFFRAQAFLGACLAGLRRYPEAEPLLVSGYEGLRQRAQRMPAKQHKWIRSAGDQLVRMYTDWQKPDQAARWRGTLPQP